MLHGYMQGAWSVMVSAYAENALTMLSQRLLHALVLTTLSFAFAGNATCNATDSTFYALAVSTTLTGAGTVAGSGALKQGVSYPASFFLQSLAILAPVSWRGACLPDSTVPTLP